MCVYQCINIWKTHLRWDTLIISIGGSSFPRSPLKAKHLPGRHKRLKVSGRGCEDGTFYYTSKFAFFFVNSSDLLTYLFGIPNCEPSTSKNFHYAGMSFSSKLHIWVWKLISWISKVAQCFWAAQASRPSRTILLHTCCFPAHFIIPYNGMLAAWVNTKTVPRITIDFHLFVAPTGVGKVSNMLTWYVLWGAELAS